MKDILSIGIMILFITNVFSQQNTLEKKYLENDGRNISCTALNYAAEEIANSRKEFSTHKEYEYKEGKSTVLDFMDSYNQRVEADDNKEFWLTVKYEAGRSVKDLLLDKVEDVADYLPGPFEEAVDAGLVVAGNAADAILDHSKEQAENEIWKNRGNALSDGIELLAIKGKLTGSTNEEVAQQLKEITYQNISPEDQAFANRGINRWMLDYVDENEGQINELKSIYNEVQINQNVLEQKQKEFSKNITKDFESYKEKTAQNFKEIYGSVEQLTRNQENINKEMNHIRNNVIENSKQIKFNAQKINENRVLIQDNRELIKANKKYIEDNRKLIVANKGQIDVLNGYVYGTLDVDKQIQAINNGELGTQLWSEKDRQQTLKALKKKKTLETINEVGRNCMEVLSKGQQIGDNLGLFESKDGKRVAKAINYAMTGVQVGMGLAQGFSGNPMGFMDAALGVSSLFAKPKPSPEMQMLQKIIGKLGEMDTKLDSLCRGQLEIKAQLFYVSERLDTLLSRVFMLQQDVYELRIDMYKSFNVVYEQLDEIERKVDVVDAKTNEILLEKYQLCNDILEDYDYKNITYEDVEKMKGSSRHLGDCLVGIVSHLTQNGNAITAKVLMSTYTNPEDKNYIDFGITNIFEPTLEIHNLINDKDNLKSIPLLQPSADINGYYNLVSNTKRYSSKDNYLYPRYINPRAVLKISEFYLTVIPIYEFENSSNGDLLTVEDWLSIKPSIRGAKYLQINKKLQKLLQILNYTIAQQNLISGSSITKNLYFNLFENRHGNPDLLNKAKKLIEDNPYLQHNIVNEIVKNHVTDVNKIKAYDKLYTENLGQKVAISKIINEEFYNDIEVYLPDIQFAIIADFTYPQELYELIEIRNLIKSKIVDYSLFMKGEKQIPNEITSDIKVNLIRSKLNFEYLTKQ